MYTAQHGLLPLFIIALPIACISWTVTHEDIFRELHEFCIEKSNTCRHLYQRKFFYLLTCEFCFSHYVTAFFLVVTRYKLLFPDWPGYLISGFSLVWLANTYIALFALLRLDVKKEKIQVDSEKGSSQHKPDAAPRRINRV